MNTASWRVVRDGGHRLVAPVTIVALVGAAASVSIWGGTSALRSGSELLVYLALAVLWNLIAGYAGLLSIGQQAYVGIGAYFAFAACRFADASPFIAIPLAGMVAGVVSLLASRVLFRLSGAHFAVTSWVLAEILHLGISHVEALGGGSGMSLPSMSARALAATPNGRAEALWYSALALAVLTTTGSWWWMRSPSGLALTAVRDNESAAASLGVDVAFTKLRVYVITAIGTGCAGAIAFLGKLRISPDAAFDVQEWTASIIFIVVIGGIGTLEGPILGTLVYFALRYWFADFGSWYLMALGAIAVITMVFAPTGLWGLVAARFGVEALPVRRRLKGAG